jgi:predicted PurR-regulated permease PerM
MMTRDVLAKLNHAKPCGNRRTVESDSHLDARVKRGIRLIIAAPVIYGLGWAAVAIIQVYLFHLPFAELFGAIAYFSSVIPILPGIVGLTGIILVVCGSR